MPSAAKYLTDQFSSDHEACAYLENRGFTLTRHWEWVAPKHWDAVQKDFDAIDYLIFEWDFGGLCGLNLT